MFVPQVDRTAKELPLFLLSQIESENNPKERLSVHLHRMELTFGQFEPTLQLKMQCDGRERRTAIEDRDGSHHRMVQDKVCGIQT